MRDQPSAVQVLPFTSLRNLPQLRLWLDCPHVARWWGDPDEAFSAVGRHPSDQHAVITADGRPVGYICWQHPNADELLAAGLSDLPSGHIDVDILIGEADSLDQGVGPEALHLLLDRLQSEGVCSVGMASARDNRRALRAFEKVGFTTFREFEWKGQRMYYVVKALAE